MMQFKIIPVTQFQQNTSVIWCEKTMEGAIVDPGGECGKIIHVIEELGIKITKILLTHGHIDHVGGTLPLKEHFGVEVIGPHKDETFWFENLPQQSQMFNFEYVPAFSPDQWLEEGDTIQVGERLLSVIHTPGHTPGHIVFIDNDARLAWVGDVLFQGSIGRTDFPMGDHQTLLSSIKNKLWPMDDEIEFIPGHGPMSSFGVEKRTNPYVQEQQKRVTIHQQK